MFKWFWTIFSLGAPDKIMMDFNHRETAATNK